LSNLDTTKAGSSFRGRIYLITFVVLCRACLVYCLGQKRKLLAAAAAAGVSVAFGSPLGGVLFGLEGAVPTDSREVYLTRLWLCSELDTFSNESDVMWRGFVASAVAAVSLQWVDPFGTAKLVLFQVNTDLFLITQSVYCKKTLFRSLVIPIPGDHSSWYVNSPPFPLGDLKFLIRYPGFCSELLA